MLYQVLIAESYSQFRKILGDPATVSDWEGANIFYEPWMLDSALAVFGPAGLLCVMFRAPTSEIVGIFPFILNRTFRGLPLNALRSWRHSHCYLCTPYVAQDHIEGVVEGLLEWCKSASCPASILELDLVAGDSFFVEALSRRLSTDRRLRWHRVEHERALLKQNSSAPGFSHKHLKELRRLQRRLGDLGELKFRASAAHDDGAAWTDAFLTLENSGWKGKEGTALAAHESDQEYFSSVCRLGHAEGRVQWLSLELDGRPVAMKCNFLSSDSAVAFKIAYAESYAKFSPGLLLELFNIQHFRTTPNLQWMDSCAVPDHFMINRLWPDRRVMVSYVIAVRGLLQRWLVASWPIFRAAKGIFRERRGTKV